MDQAIRKVLGEQFGFNLDIRSEYFEVSASPQKDFPLLLSWLRRKYAERTFDVVVAVGANALGFVETEGDDLFKGAQIVFLGRVSAVGSWRSSLPITGVVAPEMNRQVEGTVAFIRALQPDLERLIVISGTSSLDRSWEAAARRELGPIESQIAITYLAGLPLEDVIKELSKLPRKTAIFFLSISEDGAGRTLLRSQYLDKLVAEAAAPVYGPSALYLDTGIVGGALLDQESMGLETGALVVRLLRGEDIREIPIRETSLVPMGNWRALTRWGHRARQTATWYCPAVQGPNFVGVVQMACHRRRLSVHSRSRPDRRAAGTSREPQACRESDGGKQTIAPVHY